MNLAMMFVTIVVVVPLKDILGRPVHHLGICEQSAVHERGEMSDYDGGHLNNDVKTRLAAHADINSGAYVRELP
eukprot:3767130-Amphidinium_carterae.1